MKSIKPWHLVVAGVILFFLNPLLISLRMNHGLHPAWGLLYYAVCAAFWVVLIMKVIRFIKRIQLKPEN